MAKKRIVTATPEPEIEIVRYFITRDSKLGELLPTCSLWWIKPVRTASGARVTWVSASNSTDEGAGFFGEHSLEEIRRWYGTYPETDREMIVADQGRTK